MNALFVAIKPQNISLAQLLPGFNMSVSLSFSLILSLSLSPRLGGWLPMLIWFWVGYIGIFQLRVSTRARRSCFT